MSRRFVTWIAVAIATSASVLIGPSAADAAGAGPTPVVGQCRNTTYADAMSDVNSRPVVPCTGPHKTQTFAVIDVPRGLDYVHAIQTQIFHLATAGCTRLFWNAVGGTFRSRAMTDYAWYYWEPTVAQRRSGARWIQCDAALDGTTSAGWGFLAPLPFHRFPYLAHPVSDNVRRCLGTAAHAWWTPCSDPHVARADQVFSMTGTTIPSASAIQAAAASHCPGKRFQAPFGYQWRYGDHVITCYSVTTH
jgi:hypothetical protein